MFGHEVSFDVTGTSPNEVAERASTPEPVFVLYVSFELLGASKVFLAIYTDRSHLATGTHGTTWLVLRGVLEVDMPPSSVGRKIGLPHFDLCAMRMEMPMSASFIVP